jgi:hypothetical protein
LPPSITATTEFVVPRSMPITFAISLSLRQTVSGAGLPGAIPRCMRGVGESS